MRVKWVHACIMNWEWATPISSLNLQTQTPKPIEFVRLLAIQILVLRGDLDLLALIASRRRMRRLRPWMVNSWWTNASIYHMLIKRMARANGTDLLQVIRRAFGGKIITVISFTHPQQSHSLQNVYLRPRRGKICLWLLYLIASTQM